MSAHSSAPDQAGPGPVCCTDELKYERLRMLHFAASTPDLSGKTEGVLRWAELQRFLMAESQRDPQIWWHTEALRDNCQQQLLWQSTASPLASKMYVPMNRSLQARHGSFACLEPLVAQEEM